MRTNGPVIPGRLSSSVDATIKRSTGVERSDGDRFPSPTPRMVKVNQPIRDRRDGFTLIEVLILLLVLAIVATFVVPTFFRRGLPAKTVVARNQIEQLATALDAYKMDNGQYPTTRQGLAALASKPTVEAPMHWRGPYLRDVPADPWGEPYIYTSPGDANPDRFDLLTYGADKKAGGEGENADVLSWKK